MGSAEGYKACTLSAEHEYSEEIQRPILWGYSEATAEEPYPHNTYQPGKGGTAKLRRRSIGKLLPMLCKMQCPLDDPGVGYPCEPLQLYYKIVNEEVHILGLNNSL